MTFDLRLLELATALTVGAIRVSHEQRSRAVVGAHPLTGPETLLRVLETAHAVVADRAPARSFAAIDLVRQHYERLRLQGYGAGATLAAPGEPSSEQKKRCG
jgi:hypothetical protein